MKIRTSILLASVLPSLVWADGGAVMATRNVEGMRVMIFASPTPLRAGPADISVFLEEAGQPVLDAEIALRWTSSGAGEKWLPPCCSMETDGAPASRNHSQNKLLYSAMLPIKSSGEGKLDLHIVRADQTLDLTFDAVAQPARPPVLAYLPWLAMTPIAVGLFALHQHITRRKTRSARIRDGQA